MNARTVLHVVGSAGTEALGVSRFVMDVAPAMPRDRYALQLLFLGPSGPALEESVQCAIPAYVADWPHPAHISGAVRTWWTLRRKRVDLIHQHYGGRAVTRWLQMLTGAPVIAHMCGRVPEAEWESGPRKFDMTRFDAVTAVSHAVAACSSEIDTEVVYPAIRAAAVPRKRPAAAPIVIGSAGRLVRLKAVDLLISAFAALARTYPDARLLIAGEGPERKNLEQQALQSGIAEKIFFLGWVSDMDSFYGGLDVFVQPSQEEAFGMSAAEAMAQGVPVIISDAGGLPEVAVHDVSGLVVPAGDPQALQAALERMTQGEHLRTRLGTAGWQRIKEHFTPERAAVRLTRIYDRVLGSSASSTGAN